MPRIWDDHGSETDFSIRLRAFAVWALLTSAMTAEYLVRAQETEGSSTHWKALPLIVGATFVLAALAFFTSGPADRLRSAAMCAGQALVLLLLVIWVNQGPSHSTGWLVVVLVSLVIAFRMWRDGKAVRAEEQTPP